MISCFILILCMNFIDYYFQLKDYNQYKDVTYPELKQKYEQEEMKYFETYFKDWKPENIKPWYCDSSCEEEYSRATRGKGLKWIQEEVWNSHFIDEEIARAFIKHNPRYSKWNERDLTLRYPQRIRDSYHLFPARPKYEYPNEPTYPDIDIRYMYVSLIFYLFVLFIRSIIWSIKRLRTERK
jgi:hypothetical protein